MTELALCKKAHEYLHEQLRLVDDRACPFCAAMEEVTGVAVVKECFEESVARNAELLKKLED